MDLWDLTKMLFRRWYVFAPVLLASLAVVFVVSQSIQPDYSAKGHLQMIPPPERSETKGGPPVEPNNRWLDLGFPALGSAVILQAQSEDVLSDLTAAGYTDNFTVSMEFGTTYLTIEAIGTSREQATATVQQLMKVLNQLVIKLQEQFAAPKQDQITTLALDNGDKVEAVTSKKKRVVVVAVGLALMLSVGASIGLDALLRLRQRRSKRASDGEDDPVFAATAAVGPEPPSEPAVGDSTVVLRAPGALRPENGARINRRHEETARIYTVRPPQGVPVQGVPVQGVPVQGVPVQGVPVQGVPVQGVPGKAAPGKATPMKATPMKAAPVKATPPGAGARPGEAAARAEIAARAEAVVRSEKREPVAAPVKGEGAEPNGKPEVDHNGIAHARNGVAISRVPRPAMDSSDQTVILPAPRAPRESRDDKK